MMKDFEQLSHTADIKIRAYGETIEQVFRNALIGMFQAIEPRAKGCRVQKERLVCDQLPEHHTVDVRARDREILLVDFLSEALYLSDLHNQAYLDVEIHEMSDNHVRATLHGVTIEGFEVVEIKAVTYHELQVRQVDGIWQAEIVFDI